MNKPTNHKPIRLELSNGTTITMFVPLAEMKALHLLCKYGESRGAALMKRSSGNVAVGEEIYKSLDRLVIKGLATRRIADVKVFDDDWVSYTVYKANDAVGVIDEDLFQEFEVFDLSSRT